MSLLAVPTAADAAVYTPSASTIARFEREVAKYPADQKQSAVMACLAIVQQETGFVSADSERFVADYLACHRLPCTR